MGVVVYRYFSGCPVLRIPGNTFPVEVRHLDDLGTRVPGSMVHVVHRALQAQDRGDLGKGKEHDEDLDAELAAAVVLWVASLYANEEGAILCFLPVCHLSGLACDPRYAYRSQSGSSHSQPTSLFPCLFLFWNGSDRGLRVPDIRRSANCPLWGGLGWALEHWREVCTCVFLFVAGSCAELGRHQSRDGSGVSQPGATSGSHPTPLPGTTVLLTLPLFSHHCV